MPKCGCFSVHSDGTVFFEDRVVVPKEGDLREVIVKETHDSKLSIHPDNTEWNLSLGFQDLREATMQSSLSLMTFPKLPTPCP